MSKEKKPAPARWTGGARKVHVEIEIPEEIGDAYYALCTADTPKGHRLKVRGLPAFAVRFILFDAPGALTDLKDKAAQAHRGELDHALAAVAERRGVTVEELLEEYRSK